MSKQAKNIIGGIATALVLAAFFVTALFWTQSQETKQQANLRHEGYCAAKGGTVATIADDRVCAYEDLSFLVVPEEAVR